MDKFTARQTKTNKQKSEIVYSASSETLLPYSVLDVLRWSVVFGTGVQVRLGRVPLAINDQGWGIVAFRKSQR